MMQEYHASGPDARKSGTKEPSRRKRKVIPVLLVFVMLLGMLPTVAFATDATKPNTDGNGVYQIGTAADLLWFQQQVSAGQTSINAVLTANVDLSSVCGETLGSWTAIPTYAGTFDGRGYTISNLYISGATNAKQGLFAELSETGVVQNLGITQSKVLMSTSNKKIMRMPPFWLVIAQVRSLTAMLPIALC